MIRLLKEDDVVSYQKLRLTTLESDPTSFLSDIELENNYTSQYFLNKIKYSFQNPIFGYYGYFENSVLVAYVQLSKSSFEKKSHIAFIYEVCVHPDYRRKKIATQLMQHLIDEVKKIQSLEQVHLWVNSENSKAIALYEKLGFLKIATIPKGVKETEKNYQDELLYSLNL